METIMSLVPKSTTMNIIMLCFITTLMVLVMASCSKGSGPLPEPTPPTPPPTPTPVFVTYTGTGATPVAMCADSSGNIWTANFGDASVTRISPTGEMVTYPGTGYNPVAILFDGHNIWTANWGNASGDGSITKISPTGEMVTYKYPVSWGKSVYPNTIYLKNDTLYIINGNSISKFSIKTCTMTIKYVTKKFGTYAFNDGVVMIDNNLWVPNEDTCSVTVITPSGEMTRYYYSSPVAHEDLQGMAFDGQNIWSTDFIANGVMKISQSGEMSFYKLTPPAGQIMCGIPLQITSDKGILWTINSTDDSGCGSISKINTDGTSVTYEGTWQNDCYTICPDKNGNLWVANFKKNSVTKVTLPK
jgi:streptogramin lyase